MKIHNLTKVPDELLIALIKKAQRAIRLKATPEIYIHATKANGCWGVFYDCHQARDKKIKKGKWRTTKYGMIKIHFPVKPKTLGCKEHRHQVRTASENWIDSMLFVWSVLKHELAHCKDIRIQGNPSGHARYSRHDSRPVELRAENIVDDSPDWKFASKELMAIGLWLEENVK